MDDGHYANQAALGSSFAKIYHCIRWSDCGSPIACAIFSGSRSASRSWEASSSAAFLLGDGSRMASERRRTASCVSAACDRHRNAAREPHARATGNIRVKVKPANKAVQFGQLIAEPLTTAAGWLVGFWLSGVAGVLQTYQKARAELFPNLKMSPPQGPRPSTEL